MDHVELFQALAARCPQTAAGYVTEMWCRPVVCLYAIDTSQLSVEQREEVIDARVIHKLELQEMYRWLWHLADTNADGAFEQSLIAVELALAEFAKTDPVDARRFVLDVTGWSDIELLSLQEGVR